MENNAPQAVRLTKTTSEQEIFVAPMPILEFEGKGSDVLEIPMDDLKRSIRRETGLSGIRSIPVQYWKMYDTVRNLIVDSGKNYQEKPVFVQNNSSKAYLTDEDKAKGYTQKHAPVDRWRFDKIISTIHLPNLRADDGNDTARNAAIGITLNKEGLMVSFGMNLHVCSNFNVMGGTIMRSFGLNGQEGIPWDVMEFRLKKWISDHEQIWAVQNHIMSAMIQHQLPYNVPVIEEVVGDLYIGALKSAYFKGPQVPFNTYELSDFVQESIKQRRNEDRIANVWDLYNWGTSIMKPGQMDIGEISANSNIWSDYLINRFELDVPSYEIIEI